MPSEKEVIFDFGREKIPVRVPGDAEILAMGRADPLPDPARSIREALRKPIACPPLAQTTRNKLETEPSATAVVVISDDTRPVPYADEQTGILLPVIEELLDAGMTPQRIRILVATGTHHAMNERALRDFLHPKIFELGIPIVNHDCRNPDDLKCIGATEFGGDIFINRLYWESDIKVLTGLVESHFMAGVSGGRKSICPGLLAERSIHILHAGPILSSPRAADLVLEGNPVHAEALQVAKMAGCDMIVNVTLDSAYRLTGVFAGDMEAAHLHAVDMLRSYAGIPVKDTYDLVITHTGFVGINHYQAAKGGLVCIPVLKPGGMCVLAGIHPDLDPIGSATYKAMMKLLAEIGAESYVDAILDPEWSFVPDQWEAQMWARLFKVIPPENLIYCTRDIPERDFAWLPGTDARAVVSGTDDIRSLIDEAVRLSVLKLTAELGRAPSTAVLVDGPYGIPLP